MSRVVVVALLVALSSGCRAPQPSFNFLAPYGSPTVPPPPTGSVGVSGDYYAPPAAGAAPAAGAPPASGVGAPSGAAGTGTQFQSGSPPTGSFMGSSHTPTLSRNTSNIALASYESKDLPQALPASQPGEDPPTTQTSDNASTLRLGGMPVNDATQLSAPQPFEPSGTPINLADLPSAPAPSLLRILNPGASYTSGTPTPATPMPATPTPAATWQKR